MVQGSFCWRGSQHSSWTFGEFINIAFLKYFLLSLGRTIPYLGKTLNMDKSIKLFINIFLCVENPKIFLRYVVP